MRFNRCNPSAPIIFKASILRTPAQGVTLINFQHIHSKYSWYAKMLTPDESRPKQK